MLCYGRRFHVCLIVRHRSNAADMHVIRSSDQAQSAFTDMPAIPNLSHDRLEAAELVQFIQWVQRFTVVENSDISPNGLTARQTLLMLASQGSSPCFPFQTARMMMVLPVFLFLLLVCLYWLLCISVPKKSVNNRSTCSFFCHLHFRQVLRKIPA